MPLFLKNIAPELDIFGNRQLFNFNKDQANGENESALTLINWFTPITNVNANSTFEFLTPATKGFRFNHSLSTAGMFGNFNFEKYDRFGLATPLWGYDEITDSFTFLKSVALSGLSITGNLSLNSNKITNLANGTTNSDGVNLGQLNSAISALGLSFLSNGLVARTGTNAYASRNIAVGTGLGVSNSDGVAGNPTLSLSPQLQNLNNLNTLGFISLSSTGTGSSSFVNRSLTVDSNLTISNSNGVSGNPLLGLSTDITINSVTTIGGNISATTGTIKGNNLAVHNSGSIAVLNSLGMGGTNYITSLPTPINNQDAATKQYVDNNSGGTAQSIMHGYLFNSQSTDIAIGDHIKFDNTAFTRGTAITLDTFSTYSNAANTASIGRITLVAGKTYKLTAITCTAAFSSTSAYLGLKWHNNTTNTPLGTVNTWWNQQGFNYTSGGAVVAYITTTVSTRVELRINSVSALTQLYGTSDSNSATWFVIEEV